MLALVICGGIYSYTHRNPIYEQTTHIGYLNDPKHCPLPHNDLLQSPLHRRMALQDTEVRPFPSFEVHASSTHHHPG